jgi:hypothetical protein
MNDKIKQLAEQADELADNEIQMPGEYHPDWHTIRDKKFAELIVRECAKVCDDLDIDDWGDKSFDDGTYYCSRAIKQHFGVEE